MDVHYCEVGLSKPVPQEVILSLRLHILHLMRSYLSVKTIYFLYLRYTCFMVFLALAQFEKLGPNTLIHELGHTKIIHNLQISHQMKFYLTWRNESCQLQGTSFRVFGVLVQCLKYMLVNSHLSSQQHLWPPKSFIE